MENCAVMEDLLKSTYDRISHYACSKLDVKESLQENSKSSIKLNLTSELQPKKMRGKNFCESQTRLLEKIFDTNSSPNRKELAQIAMHMGFEQKKIRIWFANKRRRYNCHPSRS